MRIRLAVRRNPRGHTTSVTTQESGLVAPRRISARSSPLQTVSGILGRILNVTVRKQVTGTGGRSQGSGAPVSGLVVRRDFSNP